MCGGLSLLMVDNGVVIPMRIIVSLWLLIPVWLFSTVSLSVFNFHWFQLKTSSIVSLSRSSSKSNAIFPLLRFGQNFPFHPLYREIWDPCWPVFRSEIWPYQESECNNWTVALEEDENGKWREGTWTCVLEGWRGEEECGCGCCCKC